MIALGSDGTARSSREILLAGVSDYLVKPVIAAAVREAARAAGSAANGSAEGWLVGFAGTGGNGATTLAAAPALFAAERGRYASVLDLNRTFSTLSFLRDNEALATQFIESGDADTTDLSPLDRQKVVTRLGG